MFTKSQNINSDNKTQSGTKGNYNNQIDSIVPFTIRMLLRAQVNQNEVQYEGTPISFVSLVARISDFKSEDNKYRIILNDDTSILQVSLLGGQERENKIITLVKEEANHNSGYFKIIIQTRVHNNQVMKNLMNLVGVDDDKSNLILHHLTSVCVFQAKRSQGIDKKGNQSIQMNQIQEEVQEQGLEYQIISFIRKESKQNTQAVSQQSILNQFTKYYAMPTIKKELANMKSNAQILEKESNSYVLDE